MENGSETAPYWRKFTVFIQETSKKRLRLAAKLPQIRIFRDEFLPNLADHLLNSNADPIVEGDDWAEYTGSRAAYTLSKYPELVSVAVAKFFEAAAWQFLDARFYPLAQEYGRLAFQRSAALDDDGKTTLEICGDMKNYWGNCMFSEARWYWEREEEMWKKRGIPREFYLDKGRFFLDQDEYDQAEECFEKERTLCGESPALSYSQEELAQRRL